MTYRRRTDDALTIHVEPRAAFVITQMLPTSSEVWARTLSLPVEARREALAAIDRLHAGARFYQARRDSAGGSSTTETTGNQESCAVGDRLGSGPLSTGDAAELLGITPRRVRQLAAANRIAGTLVGQHWSFTREAIDKYKQMKDAA